MTEGQESKNEISQKIESLEKEVAQPDFFASNARAQDILKELEGLREEREKEEREKMLQPAKKDIFLIITSDPNILDVSFPVGKLILDISSVVPELHIVHITTEQQLPKKINENTYVYTARYIPFFNLFTAYQVILYQLLWKRRFLPTTVVSIGDEVVISKIFAWKYNRPFYVFYAYMKTLGKGRVSMNTLIWSKPKKIIVPNEYIAKVIKNHIGYKAALTEVKILNEYIDIPELENIFDMRKAEAEANFRNNTFNMITFPHQAGISFFFTLSRIRKEISFFIRKFQFNVVVKRGQFWQAKILGFLFGLPIVVYKENKDSINLFHTARLMLYFDSSHASYDPIFYSFVSGCPVLSSGDEYSKIILFDSGFEEFNNLKRNGKTFGMTIKKLVNDQYLYEKYKMNCLGFAKSAFTHDREDYLAKLRDSLNTRN